ncbi:MAG: dTMP kinase [Actinomycetota bacterium]|nr:dTMP kinase [Actinomycetota bacterium]
MGAVLRIVPFRRLWMALGLSSFGDWLGLLATAAMAKNVASDSYTAQNFAIAGVFLLRLAPAVVLGPLAGVFADRLDRRWNLVLGDLLRGVLFASIPLVGSLGWLYAATLLIECVALFWMPAKDASVPNLVPKHRLEAANQISLVATYGSAPLAALVYAGLALLCDGVNSLVTDPVADPVSLALYFNALTFLISGLVIWRLELPPSPMASNDQVGVLASVVDGWRYVGRNPVVRGLVMGMLGAFAAGGFVVGLSQTFVDDLGAGQPGFAVLFGSVFVGLAVGMWAGPRLLVDFSRRRLFGLALASSGFFLILLALIPSIVASTILAVAVGAGAGIAWVTGYTLLGLEVDDEVRGRTFGFLQSSARVVLVAVLAAGPALAALVGTHRLRLGDRVTLTYNGAAWVFVLAGVLALVMGWTSLRQMDDRPEVSLLADLRRSLRRVPVGDDVDRVPPGRKIPAGRPYPGVFIAFEGGDGSGKSTQARELAEWLRDDQGHDVLLTREPGATSLGVELRALLLGHGTEIGDRAEALLFAADRAHHVATVVRPALNRGEIVVTDRYSDSSVAYQGAGRDLAPDDVARLSQWASEGLRPDLTVLLDLAPEVQQARRAADTARTGDDRLESLPPDFHQRVRDGFLDLARRDPHRYLVLDASVSRDQLQENIRHRVRDLAPISARRRGELAARLAAEEDQRRRRAAAEAEVLKLDADLRDRGPDDSVRAQALLAAQQVEEGREASREAERTEGDDGGRRVDRDEPSERLPE